MAGEDKVVFETALAAQREGRLVALVTVIQTQGSVPRQPGSKMLVGTEGRLVGTVGGGEVEALGIGEAQATLRDGKTRVLTYNLANLEAGDPGVCGGTVTLFVEPLLLPPTLVVIGCGHVGKVLAELAKWMEFRVIVVDDRPGYATPEQIPGMDGYIESPPAELAQRLDVLPQTCIAAVTRGIVVDQALLPVLLALPTAYIGLIGSRRRWALTAQALREQGIVQADLDRIHAPIGLELGAETPKEIALSILAEIVKVLRTERTMLTPESAAEAE
jgi:xanthine dehydrogenase accessory factor